MAVFLDTSAVFAFLDGGDDNHAAAAEMWEALESRAETLVTHDYVLLETAALLQRRLGAEALRDFLEGIVPLLSIVWIDEELFRAAAAALLTADNRRLSLVDCASFEVMRRTGVRTFFAFDPHFADMGFEPFGN
jgi:predicted nucleic acid-binding protein